MCSQTNAKECKSNFNNPESLSKILFPGYLFQVLLLAVKTDHHAFFDHLLLVVLLVMT